MGNRLKDQKHHKNPVQGGIDRLYTLTIENEASLTKLVHAQALQIRALSKEELIVSLPIEERVNLSLYQEIQASIELMIKKESMGFKKLQLYTLIGHRFFIANEENTEVKRNVLHSFARLQYAKEDLVKSIALFVEENHQKIQNSASDVIHFEREFIKIIDLLYELEHLFIKRINFFRIHGFTFENYRVIIEHFYKTIEINKKIIKKSILLGNVKISIFSKKELHSQLAAFNRLINQLSEFEKEEQVNADLGINKGQKFGSPWLFKMNKKTKK